MIDYIFSDIFIEIDDILIYDDDEETHLNDIKQVLNVFNDYDINISLFKCIINVIELDFLGCSVSIYSFKPITKKLNKCTCWFSLSK